MTTQPDAAERAAKKIIDLLQGYNTVEHTAKVAAIIRHEHRHEYAAEMNALRAERDEVRQDMLKTCEALANTGIQRDAARADADKLAAVLYRFLHGRRSSDLGLAEYDRIIHGMEDALAAHRAQVTP